MLSKEKNIICKYLAYVFTVFKSFMINFNKYTRIKECAWVWQAHSTSAKISYFFFFYRFYWKVHCSAEVKPHIRLLYCLLRSQENVFKSYIPLGELDGKGAPWQLPAPALLRKLKLPVLKNCMPCDSCMCVEGP